MAVGHSIIVAAYFVLRNVEPYKEPLLHDNPKRKNRQIRNYLARLKELGLEVEIKEENQIKKVGFLLESLK